MYFYLACAPPLLPPLARRADRARALAYTQEPENLHAAYDALADAHFGPDAFSPEVRAALVKGIEDELALWEARAAATEWIAGADFTLADCALFPILGYMVHRGLELAKWPALTAYVARVAARPSDATTGRNRPDAVRRPLTVR